MQYCAAKPAGAIRCTDIDVVYHASHAACVHHCCLWQVTADYILALQLVLEQTSSTEQCSQASTTGKRQEWFELDWSLG